MGACSYIHEGSHRRAYPLVSVIIAARSGELARVERAQQGDGIVLIVNAVRSSSSFLRSINTIMIVNIE